MLLGQLLLLSLLFVQEVPATEQAIESPIGVAADNAGGFYVISGQQNRVYFVSASGVARPVAGLEGAPLKEPSAICLDSAGNLYIADTGNHVLRKLSKDGVLETIAGAGTAGFDGDGGPAAKARLNQPSGVAVDSKGNVYIADSGNSRIRMITPKGVIATVAGDGKHGFAGEGAKAKSARFDGISGLAVDDQDNLYIADTGNGRIRRITAGKIATVAGGEKSLVPIRPTGIAVDHAGVFYVLETEGHRVRRISSKGVIAAFAGVGEAAFHGDGGPAIGARLANPRSISVNKSGDIYIADTGNHRVRKIDTHGVISTVAGNGTGEELKGYNRTLVASGTNTPAGPLQVGGDALMAICVKCPGPAYPAKARAQRISGTVVLTAIVDKEGHVRDVKVIRGQADLAEAAVAAVRAWQYKPQMLEGKPVEVTASISISFVFR